MENIFFYFCISDTVSKTMTSLMNNNKCIKTYKLALAEASVYK